MFNRLMTQVRTFLKLPTAPSEPQQWLRLGNAANGMDFDCYGELPYVDIAPLQWNNVDGFTELDGTGTYVEQWIPLHERKPQVHTIYRIGRKLYRLGYAMPAREGRRYAVHVVYGAYWVEPKYEDT